MANKEDSEVEVHLHLENDYLTLFATTRFSNVPAQCIDVVILQVQPFINKVIPLPIVNIVRRILADSKPQHNCAR